ncbi:MAG: NUDIX hydrolase [Lachnospiraceae bacterium]|nr:NUDIX hydrolase [Lachnospiraceae bacterium]
MEQIKRIDRKLVAKGSIIDYYKDTMQLPDGTTSEWDLIDHKGAAAVVPVLDDGRIIMVQQFRNALDRNTLEIPAGGLKTRKEPTIEAAKRELREETGFSSDDLELLLSIKTTVAFCNEKIDIYVAHNLKPGEQDLDDDEYVEYQAYEIDELIRRIYACEIQDSKTICAILAYKEKYINK